MKTFGNLYREKQEVSEHILMLGQDGMGKRTIAQAFAKEYGARLCEIEASNIVTKGDLSAIITSREPRDVVLILNIERLGPPIRELLCPALEKFVIDLQIGVGPGARVHPYKLNRFTCIATTTREADCHPDLLVAFPLILSLERYSEAEMERLASVQAEANGISVTPAVAKAIACSCSYPHQVGLVMRRLVRLGKIEATEEDAIQALSIFGLRIPGRGTVEFPAGLQQLGGVEFERLIVSLLERMGFRAEMTRASGDGGIDIVATLDKPVVGGRYLIQCKRFARDSLVGAPTVREFYGALVADRGAVKGILITTSGFTDQAREFARNLPIDLIDLNKLRGLFAEFGPDGPVSDQA